MNIQKRIFISCTIGFFIFSLLLIGKVEESNNTNFDQVIYRHSESMARVFYEVKTRYYQESSNLQKALDKGLDSFARELDHHCCWLNAKSYKSILESTQGKFGGIGIVMDNTKKVEDESLRVIDTLPGKPADKVGVRANDKIIQIGKEAVKGMTVEEITANIKGEPETTAHIKVFRPSSKELLSFDIKREIIEEQNAICYYFKEHNIYYLSLNMFTENSVKQIEQLLKKCHQQKSKGLILDLRNNSGGLLSSVIDIAGLFLAKGSPLVITKDRNKKVIEKYSTKREPIAQNKTPIFILMNNYTASAAEILGGGLQIYSDREAQRSKHKEQDKLLVFLIGTKSFGKGSVQEVIPINHDCALKLTTALYYLPDDTCIQGIGVKPDFEIKQRFAQTKEMEWVNEFFGRESALKNSIKNEEKKEQEEKQEKTWKEKKEEQIGSDYIILNTTRLIAMLDMAKKAYPSQVKNRKDIITFLNKEYTPTDRIAMQEIKI